MPGTFPLPQQTYDPAHGPYLFGPQGLNPNDQDIDLRIDRTAAGGLNATPAAEVEIKAEQSNDGGASWFLAVGGGITGGQRFNTGPKGDGSLVAADYVHVGVYGSGPGRQLRAVITALTVPVFLAGTLTAT